jgi:hypothetical protein
MLMDTVGLFTWGDAAGYALIVGLVVLVAVLAFDYVWFRLHR